MRRITCLILFISFLWTDVVSGTKLHVGAGQPFATIQAAMDEARSGDQVIVHPGLYRECPVVVNKSITLTGYGMPVLDALGEKEGIIIEADSVTIEGFEIRNTGYSYIEDRAGIRIKRTKAFTIRNNRLILTFFGIYLEHAKSGRVINNAILGKPLAEANSGNGIHLWYCKDIDIVGNLIRGHRDGIYFEFATQSRVRRNISEQNLRYGLHFMFSNDDIYTGNTFRDNGAGVAVMFSSRIHMLNNLFHLNWGQAAYGLLLKEIYDAEIRENVFQKNTVGIFTEGSNRIHYKDNDFLNNGWAVKVAGACEKNDFIRNNFIGNSFDFAAVGNMETNRIEENFWGDYSGYDLDKNGIGDIPYRPIKLFNYVVDQTPETIILMRSLLVEILNFSEKVSPVLTPAEVSDAMPNMHRYIR
ncbi:MAG: nitrous oxide reductase family maturation protein NosD [Saprospiraceae bacterium]|nr:nitrous oxide reductase family maturation protein NosD [Saprospiraceae bacterium]